MPRDAGGGESREQRGESGRLDDWQRIEAEKPERDRARKQWDATHEPSEEFERAARPLGDEYGRDRPRHRELTPEQRAELEAFTGRSADEVLALREKDPRAEHNRDEAGRISDTRPDSESSADGRDQPGPADAGEPTAPPAADSAGGAGGPVDDPPTTKGADDGGGDKGGGDKGGGDGNEHSGDEQPEHRDRTERHDQGERGGTWVRVGFDEHGNLDWSTARYENGEPYDPSDFPEPSDVSESSDKDADADASTEQASDADETVDCESGEAVSTASDESDQWDLETRLGDHPDAPTVRQELNRYAGPEGLTEEKRLADDQYVAMHGRDRPWLAEAANEAPEVRHIICERDRAGGHDPARHDGWRDAHAQEQRAAAAKDPAHPSDSPAYHNSVEYLEGELPADDIGGKRQQHRLGETASRVPDRTAWAAAAVRALDHPRVKDAMNSDDPPANVKVPIEDVLGPDGHRKCEGYSLDSDGFRTPKEAIANRKKWVERLRQVGQVEGVDPEQAQAIVERESANGQVPWVKPEAKPIETFEGGTCQVSFRLAKGKVEGISTICYNPPGSSTKGTQ